MFDQPADQAAPEESPAPIGMRELPAQPAKPVMPAYVTTAPVRNDDEAGPGPDDSVVARDDHFEGTFTSRGTVRVMGSVKGRIEAVRVRIDDGAHVDADVIVDEAIVAGEFTGNLTCRQRLEARASGRISGRVETHKLMLHEGASVEGEMHMLTDSPKDASETIRGSAPLRGESREPDASAKRESLAPAPRSAGSKVGLAAATAPEPTRSSASSTASAPPASALSASSTASAPSASSSSSAASTSPSGTGSTSTTSTPSGAGAAKAAPRVEAAGVPRRDPIVETLRQETLRVAPRTSTPISSGSNGARTRNGSTTGF